MALIWFVIAVAIYLFYKWSTSTFDYFEKLGIPFRKPLPLLGTNSNMFFDRKNFMEVLDMWYYEFKNEK
jgi:hypothetical protein